MKDKISEQSREHGQQGQGYGLDARFSEDSQAVSERLRQTMLTEDAKFVVIGQRQDGTAFAWSNSDENKTQELARAAAPVLANL